MATALDVVTAAIKLVIATDGYTPTASEANDALDVLNDMIQQWSAQNIYTGMPVLALTDEVPIDAKHMKGLKALLAVDVAPLFGASASTDVKNTAFTGWQLLRADFFDPAELRCDDGIAFMPSQRRFWR
jgi:hypothetical protein